MKFHKDVVEKYHFRFESEDIIKIDRMTINLSGGSAVFLLDTENYILSVESDWGSYCYRWGASKHETFKDLICRIGSYDDYLLNKLANRNVINWKKTKQNAVHAFFRAGGGENREENKNFLRAVKDADENEIRFYDLVCSFKSNLWEGGFFVKEYPTSAKIVVKILAEYLVKTLQSESGNNG